MDRVLLVAAASLAALTAASPAAAEQHFSGGTPHLRSHVVDGGSRMADRDRCRDFRRDGDRRHGRRDVRSGCRGFVDGWLYSDGDWARYNNRSWESDSYNDWWHDRPDRAYPRWVQQQRTQASCEPDRMWWSGTGWHC